MREYLTPVMRIGLGLMGATISILLVADLLGFMPDEVRLLVDKRASVAEALAIQLATSSSSKQSALVRQTMEAVVRRNEDIRSIALRAADGTILTQAGDHKAIWKEPYNHKSTPDFVRVPLNSDQRMWGTLEIAFAPLADSKGMLGLSRSLSILLAFVLIIGLPSYYLLLKRSLRELDPSNVVPERVKTAFSTLAEGVLILDEKEYILLSNDAFAQTVGKEADDLFGMHISDLNWRPWGENSSLAEPWKTAIRDQKQVMGAKLAFRDHAGTLRSFMVNATCIFDGNEQVSGIIATFDDVTALERKNDELMHAVHKLQISEEAISLRNQELQYLADHDPLSGCLSRRAFFEKFEEHMHEAQKTGRELVCIMVDLDHFKKINDHYGHGIGDEVISGLAAVLRENAGPNDLAGRYGGEEFCVVLYDCSLDEGRQWAETVRRDVLTRSPAWLGGDNTVTASIGLSCLSHGAIHIKDIVSQADQALYSAKNGGRNQVVIWDRPDVAGEESEPSKKAQDIAALAPRSTPLATSLSGSGPSTLPATEVGSIARAVRREMSRQTDTPDLVSDFARALEDAIAHDKQTGKRSALLAVIIDSFEKYVELLGSGFASELVSTIRRRLSGALNHNALAGPDTNQTTTHHVSHHEAGMFLLTLTGLEDINVIAWLVEDIFDSLEPEVSLGKERIELTSSIGIAICPEDGETPDLLIKHAGFAAHHARQMDGDNNYQFFAPSMNHDARQQLSIEMAIREALADDQFMLHYQPIVNIRTGHLEAVEALLRTSHPVLQGVPISSIIDAAEQTGLVISLGKWITRTAIHQLETWSSARFDMPKISVNLSAKQLNDRAAMESIYHMIMEMRVPPQSLQFEVTETAILSDIDYARTALMRLQQMGISIALDDFGTGQSSLGYLRRFHPDVLKIDRSFIGEITCSYTDETLVSAIIAVAQRMGIRVIAEGVETEEQLDKLLDLECDQIQGYFVSRAIPHDAMDTWLAENQNINITRNSRQKAQMEEVA